MSPRHVAVAAPHPAAVVSAEQAIAAGGNALDAALAAAAMLTVVYPHQCGLGGDLIALVRKPGEPVRAIVSAGAAPAAVDTEMLGREAQMPGQGPHTVTVPGVVAGWEALAGFGAALPLAPALERAAATAREGYVIPAGLDRALQGRREVLLQDEGMVGVFGDGAGGLLSEGAVVRQPRLADTLEELAADPGAMYSGRIPESIAARLRALGGAMAASDFADHVAEIVDPLHVTAGTADWWVAPPPTGGAVLLGILPEALAEASARAETADGSPERESTTELVAAVRDAALTRTAQLGDPRGGEIDLEALLNPRRKADPADLPKAGRQLGDTVAIVAGDTDGTVVTLIQSVYQWFGSGILDPGTGVVLHNRGAAFSVDQRHPGRIGPGLRPPHTLLPVIAETDTLVYALGCQGGSAQPWILAQLAPDLLDEHADPEEILGRGRWVIGAKDLGHPVMTLVAEPGTAMAVDAARTLGLPVAEADGLIDEAGHVQVVRLRLDTEEPVLDAASDPRADGIARIVLGPHAASLQA